MDNPLTGLINRVRVQGKKKKAQSDITRLRTQAGTEIGKT